MLSSMRLLQEDMGMLSGLAACYGTANEAHQFTVGLAQEGLLADGQYLRAPRPLTDQSVYDLASLTKLYTLVGVLQLVERGVLRLEDKICDLDTRFVHLTDCSLADCLSYQAILRTPQRVDAQPDAQRAHEMLWQIKAFPMEGERLYSDMNALVLGYVVEAVSGLPLIDCFREHIFAPAGLAETWAQVPPDRMGDVVNYNYEHRVINGVYQLLDHVPPGSPHDPKARLLQQGRENTCGHAGLFATAGDVCRFVQALLAGRLISQESLLGIGINRTGYLTHTGQYRQFLGQICFARSPIQRLSEVPEWMGRRAFGLSGYTGNHLAIDPEAGVFDLLLGNRCHMRLSQVAPESLAEELGLHLDGSGEVAWPDGRKVRSSFRFIHQKDRLIHRPVRDCMVARGWLDPDAMILSPH